jgi:prepilin peptidase CpaA
MSNFIELTTRQLQSFDISILQLVALAVLLLVATVVDVRERRIPNWLVATGLVVAISFHALAPHGEGIFFALSGLAVGLATLLPMYVLRVMGAGDVKLMGMIGAFLGMSEVLGVVLASMVAGGVFALAMAVGKRMLPQLFANLRGMLFMYHIGQVTGEKAIPMSPAASVGNMPYAAAITVGTLVQLTLLHL